MEDAPDLGVAFLFDRKGKLAADQIVREIGEQRQIGAPVQQVQREQEVAGDPVAMGFDIDGDTRPFREPHPSVQKRQAIFHPARADVRLQVDVADRKFARQLQRQAQVLDAPGKTDALDLQSGAADHFVEADDVITVGVMRADAVEPGLDDNSDVFLETAFAAVRMPALHRPERLKDKQLLHQAARELFRSAFRFTPGSASAAGSGLIPAAISISASLMSLATLLQEPRPAAARRRPSSR
ncbi:hypothetical protein D9M68_176030 [compost metagenome]